MPLSRQHYEMYLEIYRQMLGNSDISFKIGIDDLTRIHFHDLRPSKPASDIEFE